LPPLTSSSLHEQPLESSTTSLNPKTFETLSRWQVVEVSATSRQGLQALEEALLLQAELMDIRADVTCEAEAVVLEARQDKGQGPLASMIVKCGTLKPGAHLVLGQLWGKVRALRDMSGKLVKAAGPSMPVEVLGLKGLPETGDEVLVVASEERARKIAEGRAMQADRKKRDSTVMVRGFGDFENTPRISRPEGL
jgi:translation initiation factor IF-2